MSVYQIHWKSIENCIKKLIHVSIYITHMVSYIGKLLCTYKDCEIAQWISTQNLLTANSNHDFLKLLCRPIIMVLYFEHVSSTVAWCFLCKFWTSLDMKQFSTCMYVTWVLCSYESSQVFLASKCTAPNQKKVDSQWGQYMHLGTNYWCGRFIFVFVFVY